MLSSQSTTAPAIPERLARIEGRLREFIGRMLGIDGEHIDAEATFIEQGAESLLLLQASQHIHREFGIRVPFRRMMDDLSTLTALSLHFDRELPADAPLASAPPVSTPPDPPPTTGPVEAMAQQLQELLREVEMLRQGQADAPAPAPAPTAAPAPAESSAAAHPFASYRPTTRATGLSRRQQEHLDALIERLAHRTRGSKNLAQESRPTMADNRGSAGFRREWKELLYPIAVDRAAGARIWDVDGNEYVDLSMGFGSLLFGHSPPFVIEALRRQVARGLQIGLQSPLAGEATRLICEMTGMERATFFNSGTEAVMTSIRLARTVTGRGRIAIFKGSYHGFFDEVLVDGGPGPDGGRCSFPLVPGVSPWVADSVLVLDYGRPESLDVLRGCAGELAAVLVEPIQSRTPKAFDVKPFLAELRELTAAAGTALIFDEVISGFRFHQGGVQGLTGVRADMATYGKAIGGGVPVGAIAGKAQYLDAIDGGMWNFGDESYPAAEMTFVSGTYFKHPLNMAAIWAALHHLEQSGPALQEKLTAKTARMAKRLGDWFDERQLPIRIEHMASLFRFRFGREVRYPSVFYYHLLEHGVHVWEGRTFYLSTAHTEADVDHVVAAVQASVEAFADGDFLPRPAPPPQGPSGSVPATDAQRELWTVAQLSDDASRAYNEGAKVTLRGSLRRDLLASAIEQVVARHESLRASFNETGDQLRIAPPGPVALPCDEPADRDQAERRIAEEADRTFDLLHGPLFRVHLFRLAEDEHVLSVTFHHTIADGMSNGHILAEIGALYSAACRGEPCELDEPTPFREFAAWQDGWRRGPEMAAADAFWTAEYATVPPTLELPCDRLRPAVKTYAGGRRMVLIEPALYQEVKQMGARHGCTLFATTLAAFQILLHQLSGQDDVVVAASVAGQAPTDLGSCLVGYCVNVLPLRSRPQGDPSFSDYLAATKQKLLDAFEHQHHPFSRLVRKLNLPRDPARTPLASVALNVDRVSAKDLNLFGLTTRIDPNPPRAAKWEILLDVRALDEQMEIHCEYNADLFDPGTIDRWLDHLRTLLARLARDPAARLSELPQPAGSAAADSPATDLSPNELKTVLDQIK